MNDVRAIDIRLLGKKRTGDEAVFFNLTKELLALDTEHQYLLLTNEQDSKKIAVIQGRLGCIGQKNVRFVSLYGKNRFVWNLLTLPWFLAHQRVDVFHTQYILPFFVPKHTKVVNHIHDISFQVYPKLIRWQDRLFLALFIPRSLRRANSIVTPSQFTKNEITRYYGISAEKIFVIANALSEDFFANPENGTARVREKYHLPKRYIMYIGTFQPRKNLPFLLRAFGNLKRRLPDMNLVLVGNRKGYHVDDGIATVIRELGLEAAVFFPGYVETQDLPHVIKEATVFAFPSLYEGFGIPLLEAMSQGVPIASSDILCLREVAGDAALYFDPTSIASCEEKLYTLCTDKNQREKSVSAGRDRLSLFSWRKSAQDLLALYNEIY